MRWTNEELGNLSGFTRQTFATKVADLLTTGKFKKKLPGRGYSRADVEKLSDLFGFDFENALKLKQKRKK